MTVRLSTHSCIQMCMCSSRCLPRDCQDQNTAVNRGRSSPERGQTSPGHLTNRCRATAGQMFRSTRTRCDRPQPVREQGRAFPRELPVLSSQGRGGGDLGRGAFQEKEISGQASIRRRCGTLEELKGHWVRWKASQALGCQGRVLFRMAWHQVPV